uniref:BAR/IMD domain-containing adapter protein 2-like 1 n=1 Tax=Denticeps clupeoides TaxID=299321 RepID=A0AAY4DID7_9TELE
MSRDPDDVNKLTESTYKNVVEQFNPALRNLVNLGKSYEKSVAAMTLAGKAYFDGICRIGENAAVSPVSRELGVVLMEISETQRRIHTELDEIFKKFHREIITELEKKTELDVKYMTATFKRYQSEHKLKQDSLERSHSDLKKLKRKSQGKHSTKYEIKENECLEAISSRQTEMHRFIADGCREALMEEKRRFCFLVDKHWAFTSQISDFHEKAREMLAEKLPNWHDKCSDGTQVPDSVMNMIEGLHTPETSPQMERHGLVIPPPAPALKAQTSPLASMFTQDAPRSPLSSADQDSLGSSSLSGSASVSSGGVAMIRKLRVVTIFPHTAGNNDTLLSFDDGELITLLVHEEKDGWLYGEMDKTGRRGWFPSSYCRPCSDPAAVNRVGTPVQSRRVTDVQEPLLDDEPVLLPPPDYSDSHREEPELSSLSPDNTVSVEFTTSCPERGGNPFATVKLRPTVTNDRSAPAI